MADETKSTEVVEGTTTETTASGEVVEVPATPVVVQEGALVGDEEVNKHVHKVEPEVVSEETTQKYAPATQQQSVYPVHETSVRLDTVVTDPSSPEAVQIPDAGRGSSDLPIHLLTGETPNEALDNVAEVDVSDEDREEAASSGRSLNEVVNEKSNKS
jgi:hypothetical protein